MYMTESSILRVVNDLFLCFMCIFERCAYDDRPFFLLLPLVSLPLPIPLPAALGKEEEEELGRADRMKRGKERGMRSKLLISLLSLCLSLRV